MACTWRRSATMAAPRIPGRRAPGPDRPAHRGNRRDHRPDRRHDETVSWVPDLTCSIPGIGPINADVIVAETGADMTRFPTAGHLASWAGTTPGHNESAGRVKSTRQPLPAGSPRRRRAGVRAEPEQLPRGPGPADRVARGGPHHHADLAGSTALEDSGLTAANTSV